MSTPRRVLRVKRAVPRPVEAARPRLTLVPVSRNVAPRRTRIHLNRYRAVSEDFHRRHGLSSRHPLYVRVYCLALSDANRLQHAEYAPGQLREALSSVDPETGEVTLPAKSAVSDAIRKAVETGFLHPMSSARCLVLPEDCASGGTGSNFCKFHGINQKNSTPRP